MGTLYIVATPIGNLQDITLRALKMLREVDIIACEDTRRTGTLLKSIQEIIPTRGDEQEKSQKSPRLLSYYEEIETHRIPEIISLLLNDLDVALVSDAGTPAISDPGFKLIRECISQKIPVVAIPGPSAVLTSLVISGLPTDKFNFYGYPPKKPGHRITFFEKIKETQKHLSATIIFFEAPHKLIRTLEDLQKVFDDVDIVLCRELTKVYEEVRREKISESLAHFQKTTPKGEFVILLH